MTEKRVRIVDIAEELGLSTATVSNVIHGKTKKVSDETVRRVQALLEERQYIPSMAGLLLAQNDSRIIGVVINDHAKYEGHALEDGYIASSLNCLAAELEKAGYFIMIKLTREWNEITRFASMWNMEGLVIMGFCEQDYQKLRQSMRIPFVVYDGTFGTKGQYANIVIDNLDGGAQVGKYLKSRGHRKVLCISDNAEHVDLRRFEGLRSVMGDGARLLLIPMERAARRQFYEERLDHIRSCDGIFAVSDYYALDLMSFLQEHRIRVPEDISVVGFDDNPLCTQVCPPLTTVCQDRKRRAEEAVRMLSELKSGQCPEREMILPVNLVIRSSVGDRS